MLDSVPQLWEPSWQRTLIKETGNSYRVPGLGPPAPYTWGDYPGLALLVLGRRTNTSIAFYRWRQFYIPVNPPLLLERNAHCFEYTVRIPQQCGLLEYYGIKINGNGPVQTTVGGAMRTKGRVVIFSSGDAKDGGGFEDCGG